MAKKVLVFDFDGTLTLPEKEVGPFRTGMMEDLAGLAGEGYEDIKDLCLDIEKEILQNPGNFAVMNNGKPSSRATDPYCIWDPIIRRVFACFQIFQNVEEQNRLIDVLIFKYNYRKTMTMFNPQAKNVLKTLMSKTGEVETFIVSTSHADSLKAKIRRLSRTEKGDSYQWVERLTNRVYGSAGKFQLDDSFTLLPESENIPDLNRPIYLRRRRYYDVLVSILKETGAIWQDMLVVGDHLELDLILPWECGSEIGLVVNEATPKYEMDFVASAHKGHIIKDLREIFELIK